MKSWYWILPCVAFLAACGNGNKKADGSAVSNETVQTDGKKPVELSPDVKVKRISKTYKLGMEDNSLKLNLDYAPGQDALNRWMAGEVQAQIADVLAEENLAKYEWKETEEDFVAMCDHYGKEFKRGYEAMVKEMEGEPMGFFLSLDIRKVWSNKAVVTFRESMENYTGGAHGMYWTYDFSFDRQSGKMLTFADLVLPDKREHVKKLLLQQMKTEYEKTNERSVTEVQYLAYLKDWTGSVNFPMESCGMTDKGLVFCYAPYSIDSFAGGAKEFTLPYAELQGCLAYEP